jgi:hypothetical protein
MILLISYDLRGHERPAAYARVKSYIEQHAQSCIRPLYSQWLVETTADPDAWVKAFQENQLVDSNDCLFICQVRRPYQGLLAKAEWDWLSTRLTG